MNNGTIFIISGASGVGKTSLIQALLQHEECRNLHFSISYTTRPLGHNEKQSRDYFFVTQERFLQMVEQGVFLEYAKVFDRYYYGTQKKWVNEQIAAGQDVLLELDWQGSTQIKSLFPQSISILILPRTSSDVHERLHQRTRDVDDTIDLRSQQTAEYMGYADQADYVIYNDNFQQALTHLKDIITGKAEPTRHST